MTQNSSIPESVVEKIKKLLELSKSNFAGEADAALIKAKELATRFQLDIAKLGEIQNDVPLTEEDISLGKRRPIAQNLINWILGRHFDVRVIYWGSRLHGRSMSLMGSKNDIEMAKFVNSFLRETFMARWHKYKMGNVCALDLRNSFLYGLAKGLDEKLTQARIATEKTVLEEIKSTDGAQKSIQTLQNFSLMVISKKELLDIEFAKRYPKAKKMPGSRRMYRNDIIEDGKVEGRTITISRPLAYSNVKQIN